MKRRVNILSSSILSLKPLKLDAIAFISNKNNNDTLVALKDVILFMQGKPQTTVNGLVFDNPNSSTRVI
jgi:hypothetical protein